MTQPEPLPPADGVMLDETGKPVADVYNFDGPSGISVAGLVLGCPATGRVLMLQRGIDDLDDPASGTWEFPGGHLEEGEDAAEGAKREWSEEIGRKFPSDAGDPVWTWVSPNGIYQGFIFLIGDERDVDLDAKREVRNPDQDYSEQAAWWTIPHARANPALRSECRDIPWDDLARFISPPLIDPSMVADAMLGDDWDPLAHPRDYRGRFIEEGQTVEVPGGRRGVVTKIIPDKGNQSTRVRVHTDDGRTGLIDSSMITVLNPDRNDLPSIGDRIDTSAPEGKPKEPPTVARSAEGSPIQTGDRVTHAGDTGTVTEVHPDQIVYRPDDSPGENRTAPHDAVTHVSTDPAIDVTPIAAPTAGDDVPDPVPDYEPAVDSPDPIPPYDPSIETPNDAADAADVGVGDRITTPEGRRGVVDSIGPTGSVVYTDADSGERRVTRSDRLVQNSTDWVQDPEYTPGINFDSPNPTARLAASSPVDQDTSSNAAAVTDQPYSFTYQGRAYRVYQTGDVVGEDGKTLDFDEGMRIVREVLSQDDSEVS